jgi:hypothetical protein
MSATLINQTSGNVEWYTPFEIVNAAREAMDGIDLDPASCVVANETVKATTIFTINDDGLSRDWRGRVWMNHPFGRNNAKWVAKLVGEYESGRVEQACCITFASTSEKWFKPLLDYPQCYLHGRTRYIGGGDSPPKGSVVTYLGPHLAEFWRNFSPLGTVKIAVCSDLIAMLGGKYANGSLCDTIKL